MIEYDRGLQRVCPSCGNVKAKLSFYKSLRKVNDYLPLCKECERSKYKTVFDKTKSQGAALWAVCMQMGLPLIKSVYDATMQKYDGFSGKGKRPSMFSLYYDTFREFGITSYDLSDCDMELSDFIAVGSEERRAEIEETTNKEAMRGTWNKVWGESYSDEDCERLDEYYNSYTADRFDLDTAAILRFRDLCKAELRKFNGDDSKETMDEILKLMKLLKLDNFKENSRDEMEKHIERQIWMIENTKPSECEDLEKYKDISGFETAYQHIMRGMQNLIAGTRNYPNVPKAEE